MTKGWRQDVPVPAAPASGFSVTTDGVGWVTAVETRWLSRRYGARSRRGLRARQIVGVIGPADASVRAPVEEDAASSALCSGRDWVVSLRGEREAERSDIVPEPAMLWAEGVAVSWGWKIMSCHATVGK